MSLYESQPLFKKRWRGITYDYAQMIENTPNVEKLVCLTQFEINWLQANVQYMTWQNRWTNCPCTPEELAQMGATLEDKLMNCFDLTYNVGYLVQETNADLRQGYNDAYTLGGIPELNPDTPTDFYSGDGSVDRLEALCMAVDTYVRSYLSDWVRQAQLAQLGLFFGGLAISVTPFIGIVASFAIGGLALITQTAIDACRDEDAIADVVCCMYNALNGQAVNETNFENSLNGCGFMVGSNEAIIRDLVASDLSSFDNWLTFLNALGDSYLYMQAGVDYTCPCVENWCYVYRPRWSDQEGWTFINGRNVNDFLWTTATGLGIFQLEITQAVPNATSLLISVNTGQIKPNNQIILELRNGLTTVFSETRNIPANQSPAEFQYDIESVGYFDYINIYVQAGTVPDVNAFLEGITLVGVGANPIGVNNCP